MPEHLKRKLSDAELDKKKKEIERRNEELEAASAAKAELFAHGRGTAEDERAMKELIERQANVTVKAFHLVVASNSGGGGNSSSSGGGGGGRGSGRGSGGC